MINLPFEEIIKTIVEKSSLSEEEVKRKIDAKLEHLSGLISKEGAAHIIANELGINFSEMEKKLQVSQIQPGMRNVSLTARVVQKYEKREFNTGERQGKVANLLIGDESGVTRLVMWNDQTDTFDTINENDTLRITNANARSGQNGRMELHLNDQSKLEVNPEGETVNRPEQPKTEIKKISDLNESDSNVEIMGTILNVFDPKFFEVDPSTGRRIRPASDGKFYSPNGEEVKPDYSYVFNLYVDDGTSSIRVACFRNQMQAVVSKTHDEIISFKDDPNSFAGTKNELLGHIIKIQGRVVRNEMFDRTEIIASRVYMDPDPEREMENKGNAGQSPVKQDTSTSDSAASPSTSSPQPSPQASVTDDNPTDSIGQGESAEADDSLKPSEMEHDVPEKDVNFSDAASLPEDEKKESSEEGQELNQQSKKNESEEDLDDLENLDELDELDEDDEV